MTSIEAVLHNTSADPLRAARAHVSAGGRAIGLVGPDIPFELIIAAGAFPLQLSSADDRPTPHADRHFEPSFPPFVKFVAEQWMTGQLDFLSAVIFSRASDSIQRCYYYLSNLRDSEYPDAPVPLIFDIAKIPRAASLSHTHQAIRTLAREVSADLARVRDAIALRDQRRGLFARLAAARRSQEAPSGALCAKILRTADTFPVNEFDIQMTSWLAEPRPTFTGPRVLLAGTDPMDDWIHEAVEQVGGRIVAEVGEHGIERLGPPIGPSADPVYSLAQHYHFLNGSPRSFVDPAVQLTRCATEYGVDAAILWLAEEDEVMPWQVPALKATLAHLGVPFLILARQGRPDRRDGAAKIFQFIGGLGSHA